MPNRHPVTVIIDFHDHEAMAGRWGDECAWHIGRAHVTTSQLQVDNAVRAARMAAWHAIRVQKRRRYDDETNER